MTTARILALLAAAAPALAQAPTDWSAASGSLPQEGHPGWSEFTDPTQPGSSATLAPGLLSIDTTGGVAMLHGFRFARTGTPLPSGHTIWVEAEVRVASQLVGTASGGVARVGLAHRIACPYTLVLSNGIASVEHRGSTLIEVAADTTSATRVWRLEVDFGTWQGAVSVDGVTIATFDANFGPSLCDYVQPFYAGVSFGDFAQAQGGVSEWVAVRHNVGEATGSICTMPNPNSIGLRATTFWNGSTVAADDDLTLRTFGLPTGAPGYYLCSRSYQEPSPVVASQGLLCLAGSIGRLSAPGQVVWAGAAGDVSLDLDLTALPQPNGFVPALAGEMWLFQLWYRDAGPTSNFSSALYVVFE